ncbi:competence protein ComFC [Amphibacillus cookii]|nr:ComF family protein [Amphibacillus cookii]MBM7540018.1 competence protein ComFC [Amphibacillus cookii]
MHVIEEPTCDYCGRNDLGVCNDCNRWRPHMLINKNRAVYRYNPFLKDLITRFKYRGDYILIEALSLMIKQTFITAYSKLPKKTVLVPIPLSSKRLQNRGFNQAEAIAKCLPYPTVQLLRRTEGEKQAKKNRKQRLTMKNPFELMDQVDAELIILIDDIYTTGATIHHAAQILKENGYRNISSFTLVR